MEQRASGVSTDQGWDDRRSFAKAWGAEIVPGKGALFRIWAPAVAGMTLRLGDDDLPMSPAGGGWFERLVRDFGHVRDYAFVLPDGQVVPDPAARAQSADVHGPSLLVDPRSYRWKNAEWRGRPWHETVIYELHVGTFTPEGTFRAAIERLPHLARLGVTAIELMPVNTFGGTRGWGYEGVLLYAPYGAYGSPEDMKAFVDAAHGEGLMVFLDVVYNHFGPIGNYVSRYAPEFFDAERHTPWGNAMDLGRPEVRRFFLDNALYWLEEYYLDGLRLDAVDELVDDNSPVPFLQELAMRVREGVVGRAVHLAVEDPLNRASLVERSHDGQALYYQATWNDDMHHAMQAAVAGSRTGFFVDFADRPWAWLRRTLAEGFGYQGEAAPSRNGQPLGEASAHLPPTCFIDFLQNHDQIGNRAFGDRLRSFIDPKLADALAAVLLLSPHIPLLFMGEEFAASSAFHFFCDHPEEMARNGRAGRLGQVRNFGVDPDGTLTAEDLPDPNAVETFAGSTLDWTDVETDEGQRCLTLHRALIDRRRRFIMPLLGSATGHGGAVIEAADGVLAVNWKLGDKVLQMRANLTAEIADAPLARGELVYADPADARDQLDGGRLPGFGVVVTLA